MKKTLAVMAAASILVFSHATSYAVEDGSSKKVSVKKKKVYDEVEFVKLINNKSKQQIIDSLGTPVSKAQSSKPSGADDTVQKFGTLDNSKKDNVEMWYYKNIVRYDPKHTYSKVELTFVSDRCQNVAYFNEK